MGDLGWLRRQVDGDDVEAAGGVARAAIRGVLLTHRNDLSLFLRRHFLDRIAKIVTRLRLHLHKYYRAGVVGDDIDLADTSSDNAFRRWRIRAFRARRRRSIRLRFPAVGVRWTWRFTQQARSAAGALNARRGIACRSLSARRSNLARRHGPLEALPRLSARPPFDLSASNLRRLESNAHAKRYLAAWRRRGGRTPLDPEERIRREPDAVRNQGRRVRRAGHLTGNINARRTSRGER